MSALPPLPSHPLFPSHTLSACAASPPPPPLTPIASAPCPPLVHLPPVLLPLPHPPTPIPLPSQSPPDNPRSFSTPPTSLHSSLMKPLPAPSSIHSASAPPNAYLLHRSPLSPPHIFPEPLLLIPPSRFLPKPPPSFLICIVFHTPPSSYPPPPSPAASFLNPSAFSLGFRVRV